LKHLFHLLIAAGMDIRESLGAKTSHLLRWAGGAWWDDFHRWWDEFSETGRFAVPGDPAPTADGLTDIATLSAEADIARGATGPAEEMTCLGPQTLANIHARRDKEVE